MVQDILKRDAIYAMRSNNINKSTNTFILVGWSAGMRNLIFYVDDRSIGGRNHIWIQDALTVSLAMFRWMGLEKNLEKTKYLVCTHGYIWGEWSEAAYKRRSTGEGETFRERKQARVSCTVCRVTVAASSLKGHMWTIIL